MRTFFPIKTLVLAVLLLVILLPAFGFLLFSVVFFLFENRISFVPWLLFLLLGLWLAVHMVIDRTCGICISAEAFINHGDHTPISHSDRFEIRTSEIRIVEFKKKGILRSERPDLTDKDALILTLNDDSCKYIPLTYYTKCQTKRMLKLLESKLEFAAE